MLNPHGYMSWSGETGQDERDTVRCAHCTRHIRVKPGALVLQSEDEKIELGWCSRCGAVVCPVCAATGVCRPAIMMIEASVAENAEYDRLMREVGLG